MKEGQIRAVAYARASARLPTAAREELRQLAQIRAHCIANDMLLVGSVLSGGSGASLEEIVSRAVSPERPFDALVVTCVSRLSRSLTEIEQIRARLAKANVEIIALSHQSDAMTGWTACR